MTASVLSLAMVVAGARQPPAVYDGSFAEYAQEHLKNPVELNAK